MMWANQKVISNNLEEGFIRTKATDNGITEGFAYGETGFTFYLAERPKPPLPTVIGSVVVADGVKYVRLREDSEASFEWVWDDGVLIHEVPSENLARMDYTVGENK